LQIFEKTRIVTIDDLDQLNHVNNVRYVQWVQDIAEEHWLKNASKVITDNYFWVLVSHHIEYKNQAVLNDELIIKTYVTESEGVSSLRHVNIVNKVSNQLIVTSETKWCFMSMSSKRPTRIPAEIATLFN
jgi:acyl-CoA thioester hydrolase